jgi:anti-sigma28 factor (negative regulator of flagellin synthesis)
MARRIVERIREKIRLGQYDMTEHAMEKMAEDNLDILDVE